MCTDNGRSRNAEDVARLKPRMKRNSRRLWTGIKKADKTTEEDCLKIMIEIKLMANTEMNKIIVMKR
jgi:hypothetical protein